MPVRMPAFLHVGGTDSTSGSDTEKVSGKQWARHIYRSFRLESPKTNRAISFFHIILE
jgi:hypothetical protein